MNKKNRSALILLILIFSLVSPLVKLALATSITLEIYNVNNLPLPGPGTIYVSIYDENWNEIPSSPVSAHVYGGESFKSIYVSDSSIIDGNVYYFVVFFVNDDDTLELELWTIAGYYVYSGGSIPLERDEPYITGISVSSYDVNPGETIRVDVTVNNPNEYYDIPTRVHVRIDKDKYSPYDSESYSSTLTLSPGESETFTVYINAPQEAGDYYIHVWVEDTDFELATDQITWNSLNQIHVREVINAEITSFDVTDTTLTPPDDTGDVVVQVKNTGNVKTTFQVGLVVYPAGGGPEYITDSTSVTLDAGETSSYLDLSYDYDALNSIAGPGDYNLYVIVYTDSPLSPLAISPEETVTVEEPHPYFEIVSFSFDKDVYYIGDDITATVTIKNTGTVRGTISVAGVSLYMDPSQSFGVDVSKTDITLDPGQEITLTFHDNTQDMGLSPGTYTGEATVLWYDDGQLKSNSKTISDIEIEPPRVSLTVDVYNIYKKPLPPNPGTIYVGLYSISGDSWSYITEQQVSFNGGEDYASVTFPDLDPNIYYGIRVWQDPEGGVKEFWGQMEIGTLSSSTAVEFVRNTLYSDPSWVTFEPNTDLNAGDNVHISIRVANPRAESFSGTINFYLDRDGEYPYDYTELVGIPTVSPGTSITVDIGDFMIPEGGTYYFMYEVNTYVPGVGTVPSDQITEWAYAFDAQGPEEVKWVIMVYLDGDNNLEGAAIDDFLEMAQVGSTEDVKIVVLFDRNIFDESADFNYDGIPDGYSSAYGNWIDTKLFVVTRGMTPTSENAQEDWGERNMGDPQTLVEFVKKASELYPGAEHYALIIWNHGGGWESPDAPSPGTKIAYESPIFPQDVAIDENSNDKITLNELNEALREIKTNGIPIDLLGFDACLMQMAETLAEIHDVYPNAVVVGSEETEPGYGWDYSAFLQDLVNDPVMTPQELASAIVEAYRESLEGESDKYTLSSVDLSNFDELINSINAFVLAVQDSTERTCLAYARDNSIRFAEGIADNFYYNHYMDLGDFIYLVSTCASSPEIQEKANDVLTALNNIVIAKWDQGYERNTWGISIELPIDYGSFGEYSSWHYDYLTFASESQWDEFIKWLYSPEIIIDAPENGDLIVRGEDLIFAFTVGRFVPITGISYCVDGSCTSLDGPFESPYSDVIWIDTSSWEPGSTHELTVYAWFYNTPPEDINQALSSSVIVRVNNPPAVSIVSPEDFQHFASNESISVTVSAEDVEGLLYVELYLDEDFVIKWTDDPYEYVVPASSLSPGPHTLKAVAVDTAGQKAEDTITFYIDEPEIDNKPTIEITNKAELISTEFTEDDNIEVCVSAGDDNGITKIEYHVNDKLISTHVFKNETTVTDNETIPSLYLGIGNNTITVVVYDTSGQYSLDSVTITVVQPNEPPQVEIISPQNLQHFIQGDSIPVNISATDDGHVAYVELYLDGNLVRNWTSEPYIHTITETLSTGDHVLRAVAVDDRGAGTEATVTFYVDAPNLDNPPTVQIVNKEELISTEFEIGDSIQVNVLASDDKGLTLIEYWVNGNRTISHCVNGTSTQDNATIPSNYLKEGNNTIDVIVYDTENNKAIDTVTVHVRADEPPTVEITSPQNYQHFKQGDPIPINVLATDVEGIKYVELYLDGNLIKNWTSGPYEYTITETLSAGPHTLKAIAVDTVGQKVEDTIVFYIDPSEDNVPTVQITNKEDLTSKEFTQSDTIMVTVSAQDENGLARIEYWVNEKLVTTHNVNTTSITDITSLSGKIFAPGENILTVVAYNKLGYFNYDSVVIKISKDDPPTIDLIAPANGTRISRGVLLNVSATLMDDHGVTKLEIYLDSVAMSNLIDSVEIPNMTSYTYTNTLNTSKWSVGIHTIILLATDTSNQKSKITVKIKISGPSIDEYDDNINSADKVYFVFNNVGTPDAFSVSQYLSRTVPLSVRTISKPVSEFDLNEVTSSDVVISVGGPLVNPVTAQYEDIAPVHMVLDGRTITIVSPQGNVTWTAPKPWWNVTEGYFIIQVFNDEKIGSFVVTIYGTDADSTAAGAYYFATQIYPNLDSYIGISYFVGLWQDTELGADIPLPGASQGDTSGFSAGDSIEIVFSG
ncbi:hypothetical protein CL1_0864 [Thermococcus cleftensis]|uniref:Uncharacterized protein n=2 Tax=Thermococcus cleftensis (strain DSM 27260 / KACC 17922 / CL1) TaxID=163003 RepID=I3ZTN5_THECF|nr:hypothetical protein CL1_0864 [Thermococcus cleftensis]